jgi:DNA-binding winged helix-turn-helix (wHTH) protein
MSGCLSPASRLAKREPVYNSFNLDDVQPDRLFRLPTGFVPIEVQGMRIRIGSCLLDTDLRVLSRADSPQLLSPKAFRLLEVLAERQPRAVSHAEIRASVWPELRVGGTSIARLVNEIRRALGDPSDSTRHVRTVPRFGYALIGCRVERSSSDGPPEVTALVEWERRSIPLKHGENIIGRAADALISVASRKVSRRHAQIVITGRQAVLEDLGSKNGTYLQGKRIDRPVELSDGDRIVVGPATLIFHDAAEQQSTELATPRQA